MGVVIFKNHRPHDQQIALKEIIMNHLPQTLHKLPLIALVGTVLFTQAVWADTWKCEIPKVTEYDHVSCLSEGLAWVRKGNKYGFIDTAGQVVVPLQYDGLGVLTKAWQALDKMLNGVLSTQQAKWLLICNMMMLDFLVKVWQQSKKTTNGNILIKLAK